MNQRPDPPNPFAVMAEHLRKAFKYEGGVWFVPQPDGLVRINQVYHVCQFPVMEPANDS